MKQWKRYCIGMLLLVTLLFVTACSRNSNADNTDQTGTAGTDDAAGNVAGNAGGTGLSVDDILFDTDGDGIYDHTDVDRDGLLETIGSDSNDMVGDLTEDADAVGAGDAAGLDGTVGDRGKKGAVTP